ncbi:MAG: glycosyltransferase family 39 protein [Pyrinomonadaceae bacterium]
MQKIDEKKILFLLIFLHLAVALPLAFYLNIWVDEASTLHTTQNGFFTAFNNLFNEEKQAPLYFLLMSLWRKINDSIFFARLFSIICSTLAIKAFFDFSREIWKDKTAYFVAVFFALHPFLFWASLEIRLYSLLILLSILLLKFFYNGYFDKEIISRKGAKAQKEAQIYFVLSAIIALYTNYYLGFLLVGCFVALLVLRRWAEAKSYFMQMLFVALAILPLLWIIQQQFSVRVFSFHAERWLFEGLSVFWNHFLMFVLPTEIFPSEEASVFSIVRIWIVRIAIVAVLVITVKRRGKNLDEKVIAFGTITAVIVAFLLFVYFQLGHGYVEIRHASVFFVPFILFVASVLVGILPQRHKDAEISKTQYHLVISFAVLYAIFFSYSLSALYPNMAKRGDWARVGAFIEQNEKPNQPIVVFQAYDAIALPYHYKGANRILPDEKFFAFEAEDKSGSANSFRGQIDFIISKIPPDAEEIWLLTNEKCAVGEACLPLENFARSDYTIVQEKNFYTERVRLLRRKAE